MFPILFRAWLHQARVNSTEVLAGASVKSPNSIVWLNSCPKPPIGTLGIYARALHVPFLSSLCIGRFHGVALIGAMYSGASASERAGISIGLTGILQYPSQARLMSTVMQRGGCAEVKIDASVIRTPVDLNDRWAMRR